MDFQLLLINSKAWAHLLPAGHTLGTVCPGSGPDTWAGHGTTCVRFREQMQVPSWEQKLGLLHTSGPLVPYPHTAEAALTISGIPWALWSCY